MSPPGDNLHVLLASADTQGAEETMTLAEKHRPPVFSQSELTLFSRHRNTRLTAGFHFTENFCGTRLLFNNKT